jgi:hypothetical protein
MSVRPIDILGGESVYCINEGQLRSAFELAESDTESARKIQEAISRIESSLSRNERAAMSFVLIDRLLKSHETDG